MLFAGCLLWLVHKLEIRTSTPCENKFGETMCRFTLCRRNVACHMKNLMWMLKASVGKRAGLRLGTSVDLEASEKKYIVKKTMILATFGTHDTSDVHARSRLLPQSAQPMGPYSTAAVGAEVGGVRSKSPQRRLAPKQVPSNIFLSYAGCCSRANMSKQSIS